MISPEKSPLASLPPIIRFTVLVDTNHSSNYTKQYSLQTWIKEKGFRYLELSYFESVDIIWCKAVSFNIKHLDLMHRCLSFELTDLSIILVIKAYLMKPGEQNNFEIMYIRCLRNYVTYIYTSEKSIHKLYFRELCTVRI